MYAFFYSTFFFLFRVLAFAKTINKVKPTSIAQHRSLKRLVQRHLYHPPKVTLRHCHNMQQIKQNKMIL
jgi:hypothetical protein